MKAEATSHHQWLRRLIGEWTFEGEADMGDGQPAVKSRGTETVRALGDVWVICEGQTTMPDDGGTGYMVMTIGYSADKGAYVGNWVGSMMTHQFVYEGQINGCGDALPLMTEGPSFAADGKTVRYCDTITFVNDDERWLTSSVRQEDGSWKQFMKMVYKRRK
ncbi:DUF1579 domain-containing protein [Variovorax sp. VNK109]|uniref:DUF1579 domain-containing protein n=1 Tax=Variovorax sp. VNK109 TaxID=3400919 RepID=UPI003C048916